MVIHSNGLSDRPDWDGVLTNDEAQDWYNGNSGDKLFVNAALVDLTPVTTANFPEGVNSSGE